MLSQRSKGEEIGVAAVVTLAGAASGGVLVIVGEYLAVRFLGVEHYGFFALAFVIAKIGGMAAAFGLRVSIIHFIPQYLHDNTPRLLIGAVVASVVLPIVLGALFTLLFWWSSDWLSISIFHMPQASPYLRYAGVLIPLVALVEVLSHVPRAFGSSLEQVLVRNLVPPAVFVAALALLIMAEARPLLVMGGLITAHLLAAILGAAFVVLILRRRVAGVGPPVLPWRRLYAYSSWVVVNDLLLLGVASGDLLILGAYVDAEQVGLYRVCVQVGVIFFLLQHAVSVAIAPVLPMLVRQKNVKELQQIYTMVLRCIGVVMLPGFWVLFFNAGDVLTVFDQSFGSGVLTMQMKAAAIAVTCCLGLSGILLSVGGFPSVEMINSAVAFAVSVVLNLILIPRWGVDGAAAAAFVTALVLTGLRIFQARRLTGVRSLDLRFLRIVVISGVLVFGMDWLLSNLGLPHGGGIGALALRLVLSGLVGFSILAMLEIDAKGRENLRRIFLLRGREGASPS
jgi:O-antigen/teichoic acid export membrane protein